MRQKSFDLLQAKMKSGVV